jgi:Domain of unknown function (DUF222)
MELDPMELDPTDCPRGELPTSARPAPTSTASARPASAGTAGSPAAASAASARAESVLAGSLLSDSARSGSDGTGAVRQLDAAGFEGTSLLVDFDLAGLLAELGVPAAGAGEDQDEVLAAEEAALAAWPDAVVDLAGRVAGLLPGGAALAGWLTTVSMDQCSKADLAGVAAAYRRLASWAQAGELAAVAAVASRFAAENERIGVDDHGRPAQVPAEAAAQVGLALGMGKVTAGDWTHLAVQLRWQLPGTAGALSDGSIDLARARLIAEATALMTDEAAASVEDRVLPEAGQQTCGQLRNSLRRAVIAADPQGAEQRRKDAERRAKVSLYSDDEGTATLAGSSLPGVHAAAAMARITAMARALKASGANGGLDLLRANIFLGLLLGTMPLIPPPEDGPPDDPRPPEDGPPDNPQPPSDGAPPDNRQPADEAQPEDHRPPGDVPPDDHRPPGEAQPEDHRPPGGDVPPDDHRPGGDAQLDNHRPPDDAPPEDRALDDAPPEDHAPDRRLSGDSRSLPDPAEPADWWPDIPPPGDADAPARDDGEPPDPAEPVWAFGQAIGEEDPPGSGPPPAWPDLPAELPAAGFPARRSGSLRPHAGLLDVILPWSALTGCSQEPGMLGRIGPVTTTQSRQLLKLALRGRNTEWRLILTDDDGRACAVERIRPGRTAGAPPRAGPDTGALPRPDTTAVVGRATLTMRESWLVAYSASVSGARLPDVAADALVPPGQRRPDTSLADVPLPDRSLLGPVLRAAERALARVRAERAADAQTAGGCAHSAASAAYRPPPRLREYVAARDVTCRFPPCGQPAWRSDLDHTVPFDQGGPTCSCNLGGGCRTHHKIKQLPGWKLEQPRPGYFIWTTPAGLSYHVMPDRYPV